MAANHCFLEFEPPETAGVHACKALAKADVRINLIDKRNFNLFQPLLYQIPTGLDWSQGVMWPPLCKKWWASKTTCRCCSEKSPR